MSAARRDWATTGSQLDKRYLVDRNFSFIALSTAVVSGDVWRGDVEGLADSDFSFIALSTSLVSGDVWGCLSSAMLCSAAVSTTQNIHVQNELTTARSIFIVVLTFFSWGRVITLRTISI
jgi:hypothetical protein